MSVSYVETSLKLVSRAPKRACASKWSHILGSMCKAGVYCLGSSCKKVIRLIMSECEGICFQLPPINANSQIKGLPDTHTHTHTHSTAKFELDCFKDWESVLESTICCYKSYICALYISNCLQLVLMNIVSLNVCIHYV